MLQFKTKSPLLVRSMNSYALAVLMALLAQIVCALILNAWNDLFFWIVTLAPAILLLPIIQFFRKEEMLINGLVSLQPEDKLLRVVGLTFHVVMILLFYIYQLNEWDIEF